MPELITSQIQQTVIEALAGADYVREQLLTALNMGPNNLQKKAYAIKCRVKAVDRFVEKIQKKRSGSKPNYTAFDATDVVGLKIICLFAEQLPEILKELIFFLEFCQTPYINLLPSHKLSDVIAEAIVYYTSEQEVMYRSAYDLLNSLDIGKTSDGREKLDLRPATILDPYSSIHIVIYMNSYYGSSMRRVPVEIQVRTAFEDIWSEIDHPRRYKGPDFEEIYASNPTSLRIAQNISRRMTRLKRELDLASGNASDLKVDFDNLAGDQVSTRSSVGPSTQRIGGRNRHSEDAPKEIQNLLAVFEEKLKTLTNELMPTGSLNQNANLARSKDGLHLLNKELDEIANQYNENNASLYQQDVKFFYFYNMESAYIDQLIARLESLSKDFDSHIFNKHYKNALKKYFYVVERNPFENDSLIYFRIGTVYLLGSQTDLAIQNFRKATQLLLDDVLLSENSFYRPMMPRQTGYALWTRAEQLMRDAARDNELHLISQACELLKDAISTTVRWFDTFESRNDPSFIGNDEEKGRYYNNLLYFCTKYIDLRGVECLQKDCGIELSRMKEWYSFFDIEYEKSVGRMDTMIKAARSLGDLTVAQAWANKLRHELDKPEAIAIYSIIEVATMRQTVIETLGA